MASTAHRGARRGLDFDDLQSTRTTGACRPTAHSKLANILFTTELARRLAGTGVTVNAVHPGTVATGFARDDDASGFLAFGIKLIKPFILTPEQGARTQIYVATSPDVDGRDRQVLRALQGQGPSAAARDEPAAGAAVVGQRGAGRPARPGPAGFSVPVLT